MVDNSSKMAVMAAIPMGRSLSLSLFQDARDYQILFLMLFLGLGIGTRDWTLHPTMIATAIASCLVTQWLCSQLAGQFTQAWASRRDSLASATDETGLGETPQPESSPLAVGTRHCRVLGLPAESPNTQPNTQPPTPQPFNWRSPLITSLGLSLLLRTDHLTTMMLASGLAIASKFCFQFAGKHWFNPANFGIIGVLLLTHDAWVSPGQWGNESWYGLVFAAAGGLVLQRVGRWDTTAAFLGTYGLLEAGRNLWLGWTWDVFGHRLMSGSLLLFALFMLTDPRAIPNRWVARLIWAIAVAGLTFYLRNNWHLSTAVFWALFALSPLTVLLDWLLPGDRFVWWENGQQRNP